MGNLRTSAQPGAYTPPTGGSAAGGPAAAGGFGVDPVLLDMARGRVDLVVQDIEVQVGRLMGEVESLQVHWQGRASGYFQQAMVDWETARKKVHKVLGDIATGLHQSSQVYTQGELDSQDAVRKAGGGLHP